MIYKVLGSSQKLHNVKGVCKKLPKCQVVMYEVAPFICATYVG